MWFLTSTCYQIGTANVAVTALVDYHLFSNILLDNRAMSAPHCKMTFWGRKLNSLASTFDRMVQLRIHSIFKH